MSPSPVVKKAEVMDGGVVDQMTDDEPRKPGCRSAGFVTNAHPSGVEFNPVTVGQQDKGGYFCSQTTPNDKNQRKMWRAGRDVTSGGKRASYSEPEVLRVRSGSEKHL